MKMIKVLVVDDSAFMRKMITDILSASHRIQVVATARNGKEALKKIPDLSPDVITLDVEMPVMDGLTTLEYIMKNHPIPVLMLSSVTKEGTDKTIQSMSLGAVDFITKPSGPISLDIKNIQHEIISKVIVASESQIHNPSDHPHSSLQMEQLMESSHNPSKESIVAIGTSTGGPRALQQVLTKLPTDFKAPVVVVQHMPKGFTKSLSHRLNSLSNITVKEAEDGELLKKGTAYIAPGGSHLKVKRAGKALTAHVVEDQARSGHQPSVDVLFESIAEQNMFQVYAVVMTGMGSDGSKGLQLLKQKKKDTVVIAESSKTAVIYGMPQAAVKTNLVNYVVDLDEICNVLLNKMKV